MKTFIPSTGSAAEWNAAYYRLEDYFRALQLTNRVHASQLVLKIIEAAATRHAVDPEQCPTVLAMQEARLALERWFENILGKRERMDAAGLISLLSVNAPEKWPVALLSDEVPPDLCVELRESDVRAGPDLQISRMIPRPIDVSPLLEPIDLKATLERGRRSLALLTTAFILAVVSFSLLLLFG